MWSHLYVFKSLWFSDTGNVNLRSVSDCKNLFPDHNKMYAEIEHKHLETFIVFLTAATSKRILIVGFCFFFFFTILQECWSMMNWGKNI